MTSVYVLLHFQEHCGTEFLFLLTSHIFFDTAEEVFFFSLFNFSETITWSGLLIHLSMILLSTWMIVMKLLPWLQVLHQEDVVKNNVRITWSLQRTKTAHSAMASEESGYNDRLCHGSHSCRTKLSQNISIETCWCFQRCIRKLSVMKVMSCSSFWLDNSTDRLVASVSWIYQLKSQWSACPFFAKIQWENKWLQHNEENLLFWSVLAICCQWLRLGWWLELLQENTLPRKCAL